MPSVREKLAKKKTKLAFPRKAIKDHPANLDYYEDGSFFSVEIGLISPDPDQPRKFFNPKSLAELSGSIKKSGVLQPVVIRKDQEGKVYLVAGERRYRAAKMAGLKKIPCVLTKGDPAEIALIENLQREDLNPIEEAEALAGLMGKHRYSQKILAEIIGKARTTVNEILTLNRLPEEIKAECRTSNIPKSVLFEIAKQETTEEMAKLFTRAQNNNFTVADIRKITRKKGERIKNEPNEIILKKLREFKKAIKKLDSSTLDQKRKDELWQEWNEIYQFMNLFFNR
jgi:ParB family chromosome partitioning protein